MKRVLQDFYGPLTMRLQISTAVTQKRTILHGPNFALFGWEKPLPLPPPLPLHSSTATPPPSVQHNSTSKYCNHVLIRTSPTTLSLVSMICAVCRAQAAAAPSVAFRRLPSLHPSRLPRLHPVSQPLRCTSKYCNRVLFMHSPTTLSLVSMCSAAHERAALSRHP